MSLKPTSANNLGQVSYWTPTEVKELNHIVQQWANNSLRRLKNNAPGQLGQSLRTAHRYDSGMISSAGFRFRRYGVFYQIGVFGGQTLREARAAGTLRPTPWFSSVMREDVPKLAQKLNDRFSDMIDLRDAMRLSPNE